MNTADQCRAMGLTVGDTIVGRETCADGSWLDSELRLIWLGQEVAVFWERTRHKFIEKDATPWTIEGESLDWDLSCRDWVKK